MKHGFKTKGTSKKKLFVIISIILVIVIAAGGFVAWKFLSKKTGVEEKKVYGEVTRGTITNVIEGTGTVEAISQYEITSLAKGDVIADYFEEGDYVKKDQLLYTIDSASIDKSIKRQKTAIEKAETNYRDILNDISKLNVKSDISGMITNLYVSVGDSVQQGAKIADVVSKSTLKVTLPFGESDAMNISAGDRANVTLSRSLTTIPGTVTRVATGSYANSYGAVVTDVDIEFSNPGSVNEGESVSAVVGDYACYDTAAVAYIETKTITAKASGEVKYLSKGKGDMIGAGETLVSLESSSATKSRRDAQLSIDDATLSLEDLYDNLEDYSIKSPIAGKVIQKNIKAGEKLETNSASAMAVIADLSKLTFDMSIDELDITKISVGQKVTITADALPNQKFFGEISNISILGTAYQGVTSYPVTVTIDNAEETDLIPGMNVSAEIIVDSRENVLMVPVSSVHMGNLVIVKDDGTFTSPLDAMRTAMPAMKGNAKEADTKKEASAPAAEKTPEKGQKLESAPGQFGRNLSSGSDYPKPSAGQGNPGEKQNSSTEGGKNTDFADQAASRLKSMIDNLDVPEGYTVVRVETGLTDGTYIEIKEKEGSLKEGDKIVLPVIAAQNTNAQQGMFGAMGGGMAPMGGSMPGMGNRSTGGATGARSGMSGGMTQNRQGMR